MARKPRLSHVDARGRVRMVDVGAKAVTAREAIARGSITMSAEALTQKYAPVAVATDWRTMLPAHVLLVSIDTPTYDNAPNNEQANNYHCDEKWFHGNLLLKSYLQTTWFWKGKIPHGSEIDVLKGSVHEKYS